MRFVWYAAWVGRRFEDPVFPDAFPHFGSEDYWQRETRDLEEQLALVVGGGTAPAGASRSESAEEAAEPSRSDFFWDL
jgi:hypothetical protein